MRLNENNNPVTDNILVSFQLIQIRKKWNTAFSGSICIILFLMLILYYVY